MMNANRLIEKIRQHTRRFAKRQYTWFAHQTNAAPVDMSCDGAIETLYTRIEQIHRGDCNGR